MCYVCRRAKVTCLCDRLIKQTNQIKVIVLQHPDEVRNSKGSAILACLGLNNIECWVGESFVEHKGLQNLLKKPNNEVAILYPSTQAVGLSASTHNRVNTLVVIDATWRKAKRIWEETRILHDLTCVRFEDGLLSNYRIRKIPEEGYLSTVESIVHGLRVLERSPQGYQSLLTLFDEMINFQINNMGDALYQKNYKDEST